MSLLLFRGISKVILPFYSSLPFISVFCCGVHLDFRLFSLLFAREKKKKNIIPMCVGFALDDKMCVPVCAISTCVNSLAATNNVFIYLCLTAFSLFSFTL